MKKLYIPLSYDNQKVDGAYLRSKQLLSDIAEIFEVSIYSKKFSRSDWLNLFLGTKYVYNIIEMCILYGSDVKEFFKLLIAVGRIESILKDYEVSQVFVDVGPGPARLLALHLLERYRSKVVLCPHNVEFLAMVNDKKTHLFHQKRIFLLELRLYKLAERILTISEFDMNVINALTKSEKASVFRYVDNRKIPTIENKKQVFDSYIVILGSLKNAPTLLSTKTLIENIADEYHLHIIGNGSDKLPKLPNVVNLGMVSEEELIAEINNCSAIVIYQLPTSGMLTRLHYLNKYGKPIFINRSYAQSSELNIQTLNIYTDFSELKCLLRQI